MWTDIYWLPLSLPGRLGTMPRPRGHDWLEDEIAHLRRSKVDILVSALKWAECVELDLLQEPQLARRAGLEMVEFPIPDRGCPESSLRFIECVQSLAREVEQGKSVVVHCRQGIGRASLLAVGVLGALSYSSEQAWQLMSDVRGRQVPDTEAQRDWLDRIWTGLSEQGG